MIFHPARMGQHNKRALVRQLQKAGVASRAALARSLGMSQPTAGKIVDELLAEHILEEVADAGGNGAARLGRPGRQLQLNRSRAGFLGIYLGVGETHLAELPLGMADVSLWETSFANTAANGDTAALWEKQLRAAAKKLHAKKFLGVILSVPTPSPKSTSRKSSSPGLL